MQKPRSSACCIQLPSLTPVAIISIPSSFPHILGIANAIFPLTQKKNRYKPLVPHPKWSTNRIFIFIWMHHGVLRYTQQMIRQHNNFLLHKYICQTTCFDHSSGHHHVCHRDYTPTGVDNRPTCQTRSYGIFLNYTQLHRDLDSTPIK